MSAKNCLVVVYRSYTDTEPHVIQCPKDKYFSKKDAQRVATEQVQKDGMYRADVVETVMTVQ